MRLIVKYPLLSMRLVDKSSHFGIEFYIASEVREWLIENIGYVPDLKHDVPQDEGYHRAAIDLRSESDAMLFRMRWPCEVLGDA